MGPTVEDYVRATAEALGLGGEAAVAHLDQTLAANREARRPNARRWPTIGHDLEKVLDRRPELADISPAWRVRAHLLECV